MSEKLKMMFKVSADSPETMSASTFERYLDECDNAGLNLEEAKNYVLSFENLNPYTRSRVEAIYSLFVDGGESDG